MRVGGYTKPSETGFEINRVVQDIGTKNQNRPTQVRTYWMQETRSSLDGVKFDRVPPSNRGNHDSSIRSKIRSVLLGHSFVFLLRDRLSTNLDLLDSLKRKIFDSDIDRAPNTNK